MPPPVRPQQPMRVEVIQPRPSAALSTRRVERSLAALDQNTRMTMAQDVASAMIVKSQGSNLDHVAREMITGQSMLNTWAVMNANDPLELEGNMYFANVAKMAKAQLLVDLAEDYCRRNTRRGF